MKSLLILLTLLLLSSPLSAQEIILTTHKTTDAGAIKVIGNIIIVKIGNTVHAVGRGKKGKYNKNQQPSTVSSIETEEPEYKKDFFDYMGEGNPEGFIETALNQAKKNEVNHEYEGAFWNYVEAFESDKALEMIEQFIIQKPKRYWDIANMYRALRMEEEFKEWAIKIPEK